MSNYFENIETLTTTNNDYRKVISTNSYMQLVLMSIPANNNIGSEVHPYLDQFFRIENGEGKAIVGDKEYVLKNGSVLIVPAGTNHNIINTSSTPLKLYTIYAPPNHPKDRVQKDKPEEHEQDGGCYNIKYKLKIY